MRTNDRVMPHMAYEAKVEDFVATCHPNTLHRNFTSNKGKPNDSKEFVTLCVCHIGVWAQYYNPALKELLYKQS